MSKDMLSSFIVYFYCERLKYLPQVYILLELNLDNNLHKCVCLTWECSIHNRSKEHLQGWDLTKEYTKAVVLLLSISIRTT